MNSMNFQLEGFSEQGDKEVYGPFRTMNETISYMQEFLSKNRREDFEASVTIHMTRRDV